jgi:hypothetical protein
MPGLKVELEKDAKIRALLGERLTPNAIHRQLGVHASVVLRIRDEMLANGTLSRDAVIPGYRIARVSSDGQGKEWVTQKPAPSDEPFVMPEGHMIKGVSALIDPDGRVIQQWVKTREGGAVDIVEALKQTFSEYDGKAERAPRPSAVRDELLTLYNIADHHLGLFSWGKETGEAYDLKAGEKVLLQAMADLVDQAPDSKTAVILNLGDFFHTDNSDNRTLQSGNSLDVDTRYAKVLQIGVKLMISCVELALAKHEKVIVRCLPGNHDPHAALALTVALSAFFSSNDRVEVDLDPSRFFWYRFGKVMLGATHGDMVKPEQMPGTMAAFRSEMWGATVFRYAHFGHVHHRSKGGGEHHGVVWETHQTLAAKDAWHHASGYSSGRSMVAITYHKDRGEKIRNTVIAHL